MPELPEVETVRRGLEPLIRGRAIKSIRLGPQKLRVFPSSQRVAKIKDQAILAVHRKAKYLLFELEEFFLLSHLGMTGSWRMGGEQRKHDHIWLSLDNGQILIYNDARRFGMFDVLSKNQLRNDKRLSHLGADPVLDSQFNGDQLFSLSRNKNTRVKSFIMNQEWVVGVGNIYASEALFLAGIHPMQIASALTRKQAQLLARAIKQVLHEAIFFGGTTISDFKQAGGSEGYFQNLLLVYGRDKEVCVVCGSMIKSQAIVGRNSFWCPQCQQL